MTERQLSDSRQLTKILLLLVDIITISLSFFFFENKLIDEEWNTLFPIWLLAYAVSVAVYSPSAQDRVVKAIHVIEKAIKTSLLMTVLFVVEVDIIVSMRLDIVGFFLTLIISVTSIVLSRSFTRLAIKAERTHGQDNCNAIVIGCANSLRALYDRIGNDISVGYTFLGYFNDQRTSELDEVLEYKGDFSKVYDFIKSNGVNMVFCSPECLGETELTRFMDFCENNLIHFYSVPSLPNYSHRRMNVEFVYEIPIMTIRREPLASTFNRMLKRLFDIVFSLLVLVLIYWWVYIIVAIITKITMPGPVIFKQERNGQYGEKFVCLKFRSMKINAESDTLQATKDDPRKTKWGNFLRRTSIDELPQFINVLRGEMSVVGPRPHMIKHTEEYRKLVDKYMVRHYTKPGITGWAQVTGSRGETSELWMMEERIKKDIWYVENWSILLDIVIIVKTILNIFGQEKGNAY